MRVESGAFIRSAVQEADFVGDGRPQIAFVGRSNVGKSSLLNRLLGRRSLARISSTPGRTRAVNYFLVNDNIYFVDLPGYGYAKVGKQTRRDWARLMERYFETAPERLLVVQLVDAKVGATPLDREASDWFTALGVDRVVVATKIDKVPRSRQVAQLRGIADALELADAGDVVAVSSVRGTGVGDLWKTIDTFLQAAPTA